MIKSDYSIAGIPIYVSPYAEKGVIRFGPFFNDQPVIIVDSFATLEEKLDQWMKQNGKKCGVIYNIGEDS